jgi:SAM-dependent methyltransferase
MTLWGKLVQRVGRVIYGYYGSDLFNGNAMSHIASVAAQWCKGTGIDFGAGQWPFPGAMPIDLDTVLQLDDVPSESQDYVFSSHTLEHVHDWRGTLAEFRRVLKEGGVLFLYLPHESMALWNAETCWGRSADHVWTPRLETLVGYARLNQWNVVRCNLGPDEYWSWFIVLKKEMDR